MNQAYIELRKKLVLMACFAIAMALLESAVVVYLRELMYPDGFEFPLRPIPERAAVTEVWREAATMIMLLVPGMLITRSAIQRFAWFAFNFGVWDLFYYVFLKALLDWPESLFTWDILFLIPVPWVGPVLAPVLVSIGLIVLAWHVLHVSTSEGRAVALNRVEWAMLITGAAVILVSFMLDPYMELRSMGTGSLSPLGAMVLFEGSYVPERFPWWVFILGMGISTAGFLRSVHRLSRKAIG